MKGEELPTVFNAEMYSRQYNIINLTCEFIYAIYTLYKQGVYMEFITGSFSDIADTNLGKELWAFLTSHESLIMMETASYLSKPALEPLQPSLLERFGDEVKRDRVKQMLGKMVRQIMEERGYALDQVGVRLKQNSLFLSAARYKKWS